MKIVVTGGFGAPNVGDELILRAVGNYYLGLSSLDRLTILTANITATQNFSEISSEKVVLYDYLNEFFWIKIRTDADKVSDAIKELFEGAKLSLPKHKITAVMRALDEADVFHICGGGYLHQGLPHLIALIIYCYQYLQLNNPGCKIVITGLTLGPFDGLPDLVHGWIEQLLKGAFILELRDGRGKHFCNSKGVPFIFGCDDAVLIARKASFNMMVTLPYVVVQLNGGAYESADTLSRARSKITLVASWARSQGLAIVPVSFSPLDKDEALISEVLDVGGMRHLGVLDLDVLGFSTSCNIIGRAVLTIGTRLHLAIFSGLQNVPTFSLRVNSGFDRVIDYHKSVGSAFFDKPNDPDELLLEFCNYSLDAHSRRQYLQNLQSRLISQRLAKESLLERVLSS